MPDDAETMPPLPPNGFENTMNDPPNNQFFALQILMYGWGITHDLPLHCLDSLTLPAALCLSLPAIGGLAMTNAHAGTNVSRLTQNR
jgi:hypothetical protein